MSAAGLFRKPAEPAGEELDRRLFALCLPVGASWVASRIDPDDRALFSEERATVRRAVPRRRQQFATGRRCAREALETLGVPARKLLPNAHRAVDWPAGYVGSISHTDELCVAAAVSTSAIAALGIDLEPRAPLEEELWPEISSLAELRAESAPHDISRGELARLIFSAKESVYKCVHPLWKKWLDFEEVNLSVVFEAARTGSFRAQLSPDALEREAGPAELGGRFALTKTCIFSAAWIEVPPPEASGLR